MAPDDPRTGLQLKMAAGELDAQRFEDLAEEGHRALVRGDNAVAAALRESIGGGLTVQAFRWETESPTDAATRFLSSRQIATRGLADTR